MALGKKIFEVNYVDFAKGMSTSDVLGDAGFSPITDGVNLLSQPGVLLNPPVPTDASAGLVGEMIASCEDPTGSYVRLYTSSDGSQHGRFWSLDGSNVLTQRGSTDSSHTYVSGKTDMVAFDGEAYITSSSEIVRWSSIGSSNTIDPAFFNFTDAFSPHPALTFNNFAYYGDGNLLLRQTAANATPTVILTLPSSWIIVALGIDPGSGQMLISVIGQINLSDTINSGARIGFYDGFSAQVTRYVQVDDMVTAFAPTEGSLYCSYGQNLGLWNGSGITFLRHVNVDFDNTQLLYKQHFSSIGSTLYYVEKARIIGYGPLRQKGDNVFYPALTNAATDGFGTAENFTHIASIGSNIMSMSYPTSQFAVWNSRGITANNQNFFSNNYNFDDELWVRRARVIYYTKVADGANPGDLTIYDQDGLITETADNGLYSLINNKGFASAFKDILNIDVRVKNLTCGLLLNDFDTPSVDGAATVINHAGSTNALTFTHSVAAGLPNAQVLVMVTNPNSNGPTGLLNGVAMNRHVFTTGNYFSTLLWGTPIDGSNSIELDYAIAAANITGSVITVKDSGTPTSFTQASSDTQFPSVTLTSTLERSLYFEFFTTTSGITVSTSTGQTQIANFNLTGGAGQPYNSSYKQGVYPGSTTMTVTMNTDAAMQINGFVIPPATSPINPGIQRVIFYGDPANLTGSPN